MVYEVVASLFMCDGRHHVLEAHRIEHDGPADALQAKLERLIDRCAAAADHPKSCLVQTLEPLEKGLWGTSRFYSATKATCAKQCATLITVPLELMIG